VTIRALVVEDEPLARQTVRDFLAGENWLELVGEAADGLTAVWLIDELRPDLVFMDVQMPGLTGLQVLERARHDPAVIFTTAHDAYAVPAFELEALDYLLKPFGRERFRRALERVRRHLLDAETQTAHVAAGDAPPVRERLAAALGARAPLARLFVRDRGRVVPLRAADITRLEADDDYVKVHAAGKSYLVHLSLHEFVAKLDPARFRRVHRSHVVNIDHVLAIEPFDRRLLLKMRDGSEILASRSGSQLLRDLIV
jgi:two-component system LytT family response regulator